MACIKQEGKLYEDSHIIMEDVFIDDNLRYFLLKKNNGYPINFDDKGNPNKNYDNLADEYNDKSDEELMKMMAFYYTPLGGYIKSSMDNSNNIKPVSVNAINTPSINNNIMEIYSSILQDDNSYQEVMTALDFTFLKDTIRAFQANHETSENERKSMFGWHTGSNQYKIRDQFKAGKMGVAQSANHVADHALSILLKEMDIHAEREKVMYETEFYENDNGDEQVRFRLLKDKDRYDGMKLSHILSSFLNAYVDIAKDPYISDGNFNQETFKMAAHMLRGGMQKEMVIAYLMNPMIRDISAWEKVDKKGNLFNKNASKDIAVKFKEKYGVDLEAAKMLANKKAIPPFDVIGNAPALFKLAGKKDISNIDFAELNITALEFASGYFANKSLTADMADVMNASKAPTEGSGMDAASNMVKNEQIAKSGNAFENRKFISQNNIGKTSLAAYTDNTIGAIQSINRGLNSLSYEDRFQSMMSNLSDSGEYMDRMIKAGNAERALYSVINANMLTLFKDENYIELFQKGNPRNIANRAAVLKEKYPGNLLLANLVPDISDDKYSFTLLTTDTSSAEDKTKLTEYFSELVELEKEFADDLVKYMMYNTGLSSRKGSINDLMPENYAYGLSKDSGKVFSTFNSLDIADYNRIGEVAKLNNDGIFVDKIADSKINPQGDAKVDMHNMFKDISVAISGSDAVYDNSILPFIDNAINNGHIKWVSIDNAPNVIKIYSTALGKYRYYKKVLTSDPNAASESVNVYAIIDKLGYKTRSGKNIFELDVRSESLFQRSKVLNNDWSKGMKVKTYDKTMFENVFIELNRYNKFNLSKIKPSSELSVLFDTFTAIKKDITPEAVKTSITDASQPVTDSRSENINKPAGEFDLDMVAIAGDIKAQKEDSSDLLGGVSIKDKLKDSENCNTVKI